MLAASQTRDKDALSKDGVEKVLNDLAGMGEIHALELGTGAARFDPNVDTHHHLVCTVCGRVRDVYVEPVVAPTPDGFTIDSAEVVFRGRCEQCSSTPDNNKEKQRG